MPPVEKGRKSLENAQGSKGREMDVLCLDGSLNASFSSKGALVSANSVLEMHSEPESFQYIYVQSIISVKYFESIFKLFLNSLFSQTGCFVAVLVQQVTFQIQQNESKRYYSHRPEVFIDCHSPVNNRTRPSIRSSYSRDMTYKGKQTIKVGSDFFKATHTHTRYNVDSALWRRESRDLGST